MVRVAAFQTTVDYNIQMAGGFKNALFGGEGLFLATLSGHGSVLLQSLPFARLADRVLQNSGPMGGAEQGSVLGSLGNLFGD